MMLGRSKRRAGASKARGSRLGPPHTAAGSFPMNLNENVELMLVRVVRQDCRRGNSKEATLKQTLLRFLSDESGATAIEYGLIAAGIALVFIRVATGCGTN